MSDTNEVQPPPAGEVAAAYEALSPEAQLQIARQLERAQARAGRQIDRDARREQRQAERAQRTTDSA